MVHDFHLLTRICLLYKTVFFLSAAWRNEFGTSGREEAREIRFSEKQLAVYRLHTALDQPSICIHRDARQNMQRRLVHKYWMQRMQLIYLVPKLC